jgi:hypothetical protein
MSERTSSELMKAETAAVIAFIWGHMINSLQGAITEPLAPAPCTRIVQTLQQESPLPREARLYVRDAVLAARSRGSSDAKGADLHLLVVSGESCAPPAVSVLGVGGVKSYFRREGVLRRQLTNHIARARRGLRICGNAVNEVARARAQSFLEEQNSRFDIGFI